MTCFFSAAPRQFLYSLPMCKVAPERWHCDSAVAALPLEFLHVPLVAAIPMVLEQSPVRRGHSLESDKALAPALCQPPPFAHVGLAAACSAAALAEDTPVINIVL